MGVPLLLKAFAHEPGFRSYARVFRKVEKELGSLGTKPQSAEILSKQDQRSALRKFFALEKATDADHWLAVNFQVEGRSVRFLAPFRRGLTLPYSLEIALSVATSVSCSLTKSLVLQPKWHVLPDLPENRTKPEELIALNLPPVGWRHDSGGIPVVLSEGGRIGRVVGERAVAWTVFSAYQGFLFNVGPRIAKYVQAAPRVEALLRQWALPAAPPPAPKPLVRPVAVDINEPSPEAAPAPRAPEPTPEVTAAESPGPLAPAEPAAPLDLGDIKFDPEKL